MKSETAYKLDRLKKSISSLKSAVVALSGGTDSSFLLTIAHDALGGRVIGVTVDTPFVSREEIRGAAAIAEKSSIEHTVLRADPLSSETITANNPERCYHCKKMIFTAIKEFAKWKSIDAVLDGSNYDDTGDFRPGAKALTELGILSPLRDAGLSKDEIRLLAKNMGIETWDKPSSSCLAARIPYGDRISVKALIMIEAAEEAIRKLGFSQVRVRHHGTTARIEVLSRDISMAADELTRDAIVKELRNIGYTYVSLDLEGYRCGSMNESLD